MKKYILFFLLIFALSSLVSADGYTQMQMNCAPSGYSDPLYVGPFHQYDHGGVYVGSDGMFHNVDNTGPYCSGPMESGSGGFTCTADTSDCTYVIVDAPITYSVGTHYAQSYQDFCAFSLSVPGSPQLSDDVPATEGFADYGGFPLNEYCSDTFSNSFWYRFPSSHFYPGWMKSNPSAGSTTTFGLIFDTYGNQYGSSVGCGIFQAPTLYCIHSYCGDEIIDADGIDNIAGNADDEQCDLGNQNGVPGSGCSSSCKIVQQ